MMQKGNNIIAKLYGTRYFARDGKIASATRKHFYKKKIANLQLQRNLNRNLQAVY